MAEEHYKAISPLPSLHDSLLQPQYEAYNEPNPFAMVCEHIYSFIAADPNTMYLNKALGEPDRE